MAEYGFVKPTKYAGILFRSRLEARWAVAFDHLEIDWEYEPETFSLGWDEEPFEYTPDFRIRCGSLASWPPFINDSVYVEVKPTDAHLADIKEKLFLSVEYSGPCANGLLLLGPMTTHGLSPLLTSRGDIMFLHSCLTWREGMDQAWVRFTGSARQPLEVMEREPSPAWTHHREDLPAWATVETIWLPTSDSDSNRSVASAMERARNERFGLRPGTMPIKSSPLSGASGRGPSSEALLTATGNPPMAPEPSSEQLLAELEESSSAGLAVAS